MRTLHISAGGANTRIKSFMEDEFGDIPKHMLPIPYGQGTLLGEIIRNGATFFDKQTVWVSKANIKSFVPLLGLTQNTGFTVDEKMTGPLGPLIRYVTRRKKRGYGCAGDHFCTFTWEDMEKFHDSHSYPVTILIAPSTSTSNAATFMVADDGQITGWKRKDVSHKRDLINIGAYIIDADPEVLQLLGRLEHHKEDPFFEMLIERALLAGFTPQSNVGFNVNTARSYQKLLDHFS